MDSARFKALRSLYNSAGGYQGANWRRMVTENMEALEHEFNELSNLNARNIEMMIQVENQCNGYREKIAELESIIASKAEAVVVIKTEDQYRPETGTVEAVVTETVVVTPDSVAETTTN